MGTHRLQKVASTIRNVMSEAIAHRLNDPRIMPMTSVTRVEVSADLTHARIYVSVMGTTGEQKKTMDGLHHSTAFLQSILARRLTTRNCPRLRFFQDPSIKNAMETIRIIDECKIPSDEAEGADVDSPSDSQDQTREREP